MKYMMKSRVLYEFESPSGIPKEVAAVRSRPCDTRKKITTGDGQQFFMEILDDTPTQAQQPQRLYRLTAADGTPVMEGLPLFADDDNPYIHGWPICRMPKTDHMTITMNDAAYCLHMKNNQYYTLENTGNENVFLMIHRGISGGWDIECTETFPPGILCGLFLFCIYLGKENEFIVV